MPNAEMTGRSAMVGGQIDTYKLEEKTRKEMLKKFELVKKYGVDVTTGDDLQREGLMKSASNMLKKAKTRLNMNDPKRNNSVKPSRPVPKKLGQH